MTFGDKVKTARINLNLTQEEVASRMGITRRALISYEQDKSRPRGIEKYKKLANALEINVNYLLNEEDEFVATAYDKYGARGASQADELINQMGALFAGGELSANDKDAVMKAMQEIYWDAKEENKKYTPKKYLTNKNN